MAANIIMRETTSGLGGAPTVTEVSATPLNNIFDNVTFSEAQAGDSEYRAIDLYNDGDEAAISPTIYMSVATVSPHTELQMGIEGSPIGSTLSIATESVQPSGVSFSYYDSSTQLSLPTIPASGYVRVWLKRVVQAGATNQANDLGTIAYSYA